MKTAKILLIGWYMSFSTPNAICSFKESTQILKYLWHNLYLRLFCEGHCFKIDSVKFNDSVASFEPYGLNHLHNHFLCCDFKLGHPPIPISLCNLNLFHCKYVAQELVFNVLTCEVGHKLDMLVAIWGQQRLIWKCSYLGLLMCEMVDNT